MQVNTDIEEEEKKDTPEFELQSPTSSSKGTPRTKTRPVCHEMEGYLYKLKHKPSTFSSWNKRYFKIEPNNETLCYYENEKESTEGVKKALKVFELGHILKVL